MPYNPPQMAKPPTSPKPAQKRAPTRKPAAPKKAAVPETKPIADIVPFPPIERDAYGRISSKDAAMLLGSAPDGRSLRNWRNREGCTAITEGGAVDFPRLHAWLIERAIAPIRRQLEDLEHDEDGDAKKKLELRSMRGGNILQDIKVQAEMKELVSQSLMFHHLSTVLSDITSRLRPIGVKIGPILSAQHDAAKCTKIVDQALDRVLKELIVDIVMDIDRKSIDPFAQADKEAAEAEKFAAQEVANESAA